MYIRSWKNLAYCYYELKMQEKAISTMQMVLSVTPDDKEANQFLSKLTGRQKFR